jgi:hypothetical protein
MSAATWGRERNADVAAHIWATLAAFIRATLADYLADEDIIYG